VSRSRVRERERLRAPVDITSPAALIVWAHSLRPLVTGIRKLADEGTLPPAQRTYGRRFVRRGIMKSLRELEARLAVVAPPLDFPPAP